MRTFCLTLALCSFSATAVARDGPVAASSADPAAPDNSETPEMEPSSDSAEAASAESAAGHDGDSGLNNGTDVETVDPLLQAAGQGLAITGAAAGAAALAGGVVVFASVVSGLTASASPELLTVFLLIAGGFAVVTLPPAAVLLAGALTDAKWIRTVPAAIMASFLGALLTPFGALVGVTLIAPLALKMSDDPNVDANLMVQPLTILAIGAALGATGAAAIGGATGAAVGFLAGTGTDFLLADDVE